MPFLVAIILIVVSLLHTWRLATSWPGSVISIAPATDLNAGFDLLQGVLAFALGCAFAVVVGLARSKRFAAALGVVAVVGASTLGYLQLPLMKVFEPSTRGWLPALLGALCAAAVSRVYSQRGSKEGGSLPRFSLLTAFFVVYNFLLFLAPSSVVFPTGYIGDAAWAVDTLILRHEDSVSIQGNLLFILIRGVLDPIIGDSIIGNSLVSTVMTSLGLALTVLGIQIAAGPGVALCALLLAMSERWVVVTSFAGNLPASLLTTCGLLFFIAMRIGFDPAPRSRRWRVGTFALLMVASFLALYSYAAVRMPFGLSIGFISLLFMFMEEGSVINRARGALLWVVLPVVCAFTLMALGPYKGNFSGLRHDLFVSWNDDSIIAHPGAEGLKNYELTRNFDIPLWKQIARPVSGANKSVMWTKTPLEIAQSFGNHLVDIANNIPNLFFLQPLPLFLALLGVCALPIVSGRSKAVFVVTLLWSFLWLSTFLLVADSNAFRRAVAFPGSFAVVAALAAVPLFRSRAGSWLAISLCVVIFVTRLPYELAMANLSEARMRMFTLCATAPAHRVLLSSPITTQSQKGRLFVLPNGLDGGREGVCFNMVVASTEWKRLLPETTVLASSAEKGSVELEGLPSGAMVTAYCNPESQRVPHVATLCSTGMPKFKLLGQIPNSYDGGYWVVFEVS